MAISIDWSTKVITVPQSDLTLVSGTLYSYDTETFLSAIQSLSASEDGMAFPKIHVHVTEVTVAGTTYARFITIVNGYTVKFEDGQYAVQLLNSNNNIFDEGIIVRNQVSIVPTNSAGLARAEDITTIKKIVDPKRHVLSATTRTVYEEDGTTVFRQWSVEDKDGNNVVLGTGDPAEESR